MARTGKLSEVMARKAKGPAVLFDGGGLYLRVTEAGAKRWVFRYQADGRRHDMGLGSYPEISLAEARQRASVNNRRIEERDFFIGRNIERGPAEGVTLGDLVLHRLLQQCHGIIKELLGNGRQQY